LLTFFKATEVEGIFRLNGSEKRIKELKTVFDSPDRYGKGLVWDGYTVHDAANVLRRYLNDLPEPVVPLDLYEKFREPLKGARAHGAGDAQGAHPVGAFDEAAAIARYQQLITELPPLNRQLLLYILDLLAVFAAKSDQNRMTPQNLAAIFQPGMLSHPNHAMAPEEYRLNQDVIIFLIENQDHFLIGMQGTAADEKTVQEVQQGTPVLPSTPNPKPGITRSASTASAGAESVARDGSIRRNKSTSSRRSFHSNGAPSPSSPALTATPTGGLARSNTVPSKKSPALQSGRFSSRNDVAPLTSLSPAAPVISPPAIVGEVGAASDRTSAPSIQASTAPSTSQLGLSVPGARSQERLLEPTTPEPTTPSKERKIQNLFQRMSTTDSDSGRQMNKLKKKRGPGSANPSAHSSTASLPYSTTVSPNAELPNPLETIQSVSRTAGNDRPVAASSGGAPSETPPRASQAPPSDAHADSLAPPGAETSLKSKKSPPTSLNSSFNEGSDLDQVEDGVDSTVPGTPNEKEKRRRWRLSRKKDELAAAAPPSVASPQPGFGSNTNADTSSTSVGSSAQKLAQTSTGDSSDRAMFNAEDKENKDDPKKFGNWIKNKYREHKEHVEQRRNKSPPGERTVSLGSSLLSSARGKSLDLKRSEEDKQSPPQPQTAQPQPPPLAPASQQ
jgi:hypothetical protein